MRAIFLSFLRSRLRAKRDFFFFFILGLSYARRFLASLRTPDFWSCFLNLLRAFSKDSSSLTKTPGISWALIGWGTQILMFLRTQFQRRPRENSDRRTLLPPSTNRVSGRTRPYLESPTFRSYTLRPAVTSGTLGCLDYGYLFWVWLR